MKSIFLLVISTALSANGAILISDNFDNVASGSGLNGRTPAAGGNWTAPAGNFLGNGSGGLSATFTGSASFAGIDLGSGSYLSTNKGIYEMSLTVTHPSDATSSNNWIGLGFVTGVNTATNMVGNNAQPWMLYRLNGEINVYGGAGTTNARSTGLTPATHGGTLGVTHTLKLVLDTSSTAWVMQAFVDGYEFDLNGATAGNSYTFTTNPSNPRYVGFSNAVNADSTAVSTIDNFQLLFTPVPEPSTALLSIVGAGLLLRRRRSH